MPKLLLSLLFLITSFNSYSQNKSGYTWIIGGGALWAKFNGDTTKPQVGQLFQSFSAPNYPYIIGSSQSNICDSATGDLLFMCNGMRIYDTLGNIMENGDSLQPNKIYMHNCCPAHTPNTQGSIILPKGSNGLYYVIIPTITDSAYVAYSAGQIKFPFDLLQYHIVDMNENGGMGKVVAKNIPLLQHVEMCKVGMMACRHANGKDWWLLKQALDTNLIYTFLVTADTIELKYTQGFSEPHFKYYDLVGQSCFSTDGTKYAFATGGVNSNGDKLFVADFDRCTGILSNLKIIHTPMDNTNTSLDSMYPGEKDTAVIGLCFSQNDSFLYVSKGFNIYQYEVYEPDSALAWFHVQYGPDTTLAYFVTYGQLQRGIDNRIYIGKSLGASMLQNSVIDNPNLKGSACAFCRKCLRYDTGIDYISTPPNMPDFNLGELEPCWPLITNEFKKDENTFEIYPNPSNDMIFIKSSMKYKRLLFSMDGKLLISTTKDEIDVTKYKPGIYFLRIGNVTKKVSID